MPSGDIVLRMSGISKRYGSLSALQDVDFALARGEVMALLGENGAGKSTLVKILAGLERADAGAVEIEGQPIRLRSPSHSLQAGVAYVTQELSIVGPLSVAENICLGGREQEVVWTSARLADQVKPFLALVGLESIDPSVPAGSLSVAQQQLVEIARLLSRNARILILDEPTAALSDVEIEKVKAVVRKLASEGRSIIYVTHRLGEVFEIADRVTIFRNGRSFEPVEVKSLDIDELIEHMLGRRLDQMFPGRGESLGQTVLVIARHHGARSLTTGVARASRRRDSWPCRPARQRRERRRSCDCGSRPGRQRFDRAARAPSAIRLNSGRNQGRHRLLFG